MNQERHSDNQAVQPQQISLNTKTQFYANEALNQSKVHSIVSHSSSPQNLLKYFQQYQPLSQNLKLVIESIHKSQNLKLKKYKQSVYYGDFINGKRHGKGIMIYDNNRVYQGDWECDYKHGKGYEKFQNQAVYTGDYVNGKPQGIGKYLWANGQFYEGQWSNGMKHGSGMWKGVKGDSYIGEWRYGKAEGYGVHTWVNGDRYQGQFKQCLKHGEGIQKFKNGDIYKGLYINGKPSGFGQYYWSNGSYFKGQFLNGVREGNGIWKRNHGNSDKYEGQYRNDKKQGYGIFSWATGNVYKGNYENDMRHGYGQMYWSDGSWYKGYWKNGIQHGEGEIYVPSEPIKKGIFQENVLITVEKQYNTANKVNQANFSYQNQNGNLKSLNSEAQRQSHFSHSKKSRTINQKQKTGLMPSKIQFRTINQQHHRTRSRQPKSLDQNIVVRYGIPNAQLIYPSRKIHHPLLPKKILQKREQKYINFERTFKNMKLKQPISQQKQYNHQNQKTNEPQERVLHSAFYMHQFHNRATTSIHVSRAQAKSGYSSSLQYGRQEIRENDNRKDLNNDGISIGFSQRKKQRERFSKDKQRIEKEAQSRQKQNKDIIDELRFYNKSRASKNSRTPNF